MSNPTQELNQKVLHKYGWSAKFDTDEQGFWLVEIIVGFNDTRRFVSEDATPYSAKEQKKGFAAASKVALEGLKEEISIQEAKPVKDLSIAFPQPIDIYESNDENWNYFWKHKPTVVGIDAEGNQSSPPVLLQVATHNYTILEASKSRGISKHVRRLLKDDSIIKVFCDNFSHHDKTCLGLTIKPDSYTSGSIVDIEVITAKLLGPVKVARGLSRIMTLSMPELNELIRKPKNKLSNIARFSLIEQGKAPPLRGIYDLSKKDRQYAALDAWCTLVAYQRLQEASS